MLPHIVHFEGLAGFGKWTYRKIGYRAPRKGEFYLSGAVVMAYRAPNDLATPFMVVAPLERYKPAQHWTIA